MITQLRPINHNARAVQRARYRGVICSVAAALIFIACTNPQQARESTPVAVEQRLPTIEHVAPARDSVGGPPARFEWTAVKDADQYAIGVWDDVDRLLWRSDHIQGTSVVTPNEVQFEFGTYFWSVMALRNDRPIAESGRSAFVVLKSGY